MERRGEFTDSVKALIRLTVSENALQCNRFVLERKIRTNALENNCFHINLHLHYV